MNNREKGTLILQTMKRFQKNIRTNFMKQFPELKMTSTQGMIIGILMHHGDMKISDLSKRMLLSNSTVSGIIDRLEKNNVVERKRSKEDRRIVMVGLKEDFKEGFKAKFKVVDQYFTDIMNKATPEELDKIIEGFTILERLMSDSENNNIKQEQP